MTWRERVAQARARGEFLDVDRSDAMRLETCAVGEAISTYGLEDKQGEIFDSSKPYLYLNWEHWYQELPFHLWGLCAAFPSAVKQGAFNHAEAMLDRIEDEALKLKRGK